MSKPWMPLYIADYLRDTSHLRALESGAYLHLIMAYWISGGLPNDDRQLATIAKLTDKEWRSCKPTLAAFFGPDFSSHKRIDTELARASEVSSKRRAAAEQRHSKTDANAGANAGAKAHTVHSTHRKKDAEPGGSQSVGDEVALYQRGKEVLGKDAGGLISKLLKNKNGSIPLARSAIETASTKENPREYIGRILAGPPQSAPLTSDGQPWPAGII